MPVCLTNRAGQGLLEEIGRILGSRPVHRAFRPESTDRGFQHPVVGMMGDVDGRAGQPQGRDGARYGGG